MLLEPGVVSPLLEWNGLSSPPSSSFALDSAMDDSRSSVPTPTRRHPPGETGGKGGGCGGGGGGEADAAGATAKDAPLLDAAERSAHRYLPEPHDTGGRRRRKRAPRIKIKPADGKTLSQREFDALRVLQSRGTITKEGRCSLDAIVLAYLEEAVADSEYQLALRVGFVHFFFSGTRPSRQEIYGCYKAALVELLDGFELDLKMYTDLYSAFMHAACKALREDGSVSADGET